MNRKLTAVVAAGLAVGLVAPATASAATKAPPNLIKDGGGESAVQKDQTGIMIVKVPGWTAVKGTGFTVVTYGSPEFLQKTDAGPKVRGKNFFSGGEVGPSPAGATQVVTLASYAKLIGKGKATFSLSGWFGGYEDQRDYSTLSVVWRNAKGAVVGKPKAIGDVTPQQRKDVTSLIARSETGTVPTSATTALITYKAVRLDGGYDDGYADNFSLTIVAK